MDVWSRRQRRKAEVKARASKQDSMYRYCRIPGCGMPARAGTSDGLDMRYCRPHAEKLQRHGSPYKTSYTAKVLNPYRTAAFAWLQSNQQEFWVSNAVERTKTLYSLAGGHEESFRLRGKTPAERAKIHWARLRKAEIDPFLVIAAWLAVEMIIADDPQRVSTSEFKRVQGAKIVHRLASGTHRCWEQEVVDRDDPRRIKTRVTEMHVYPRSRGRVLRHIGKDLQQAVELLTEHHLASVHMFKNERDSVGSFSDRPYPRGIVGRKRKKALG